MQQMIRINCAVGYLIEQTAGREAAEYINSMFHNEYLLQMEDPVIENWTAKSGFTKVELAMIQPSYGIWVPLVPDNHVSKEYGISSSLVSGMNLSLNTLNGIQIARGTSSKTVAIMGIVSGAGQVTLGILNYPKEQNYYGGYTHVNEGERNLSLLNIGLGTSTVILSSWNLIANRNHKEKSLRWNLFSFQTHDNQMGLGINLTKKL